jgi:hypothetical protein
VLDGFRPPAGPYGPGNRGIEYDIGPDTPIHAVDNGRVTFVGTIAGATHVVVEHGEGLKSTYAFVDFASVVRGQLIKRGDQMAIAGPGFHLTARLWGEYVDPAFLFGGAEIEVNLIAGHSAGRDSNSRNTIRVAPVPTVRSWDPFAGLLQALILAS